MLLEYIPILLATVMAGCGNNPTCNYDTNNSYILHSDITATVFWVGERASNENGYIANVSSAWDDMWMFNYGGVDSPDERNGLYPAEFVPMQNPFYVALPYNDFDENGIQKDALKSYIPWAPQEQNSSISYCKNRWVKIIKEDKIAYAQWEDVGPFNEDDAAYVFGTATPQNTINAHAGIDLSPAVRDYLNLNDIDTVNWQFVDEKDVPDGAWKELTTTENINWVSWYRPSQESLWQWQLLGTIDSSYDVTIYDIDLFDTNSSLIDTLQRSGKKVICYFSAGSYEEWREDAALFDIAALGNDLDGWEGERWLDIRHESVKAIMRHRLDLAKEKGCDGVEPDNMDGYTQNTGFTLQADDQLQYNKFIANEARKRGLSVGLKNDLDQIVLLEPFFDFAVNEECHYYNECSMLQPFIDAGKPVFNAEYAQKYVDNIDGARDVMCRQSRQAKMHTLVLPLDLDGRFRFSCDE